MHLSFLITEPVRNCRADGTVGVRRSAQGAADRWWRTGEPARCQRPSSRLTRGASTAEICLSPEMRRVRALDLTSSRWRLLAWACINLPDPVRLMRFFIPEWVFCLGMDSSFG